MLGPISTSAVALESFSSFKPAFCTWNASGLWIWDDDARCVKQATVQDLVRRYDVVAIEEAHVELADMPTFRKWCAENDVTPYVALSAAPSLTRRGILPT